MQYDSSLQGVVEGLKPFKGSVPLNIRLFVSTRKKKSSPVEGVPKNISVRYFWGCTSLYWALPIKQKHSSKKMTLKF